jgi:ABC-2 type transport system permease protein
VSSVAYSVPRTFVAICWRDVFVVLRELPSFLVQVLLQPLFLAFVLGRVLPELGLATPAFASVLLPGVVGFTVLLTALQGIAMPLVLEFGYTKEIEDRLLAPLPVSLVAVQKLAIAALRGIVGGLVVLPLAWAIMGFGTVHASGDHVARFALFVVLASLLGATLGLALGTSVQPKYIQIVFTVVFTPLFFTGCVQYPWATLGKLEWFKIVTLFNPMTYASEGLRSALVPAVPHMQPWIAALVVAGASVVFSWLGLRGFRRRAVD